MLRHLTAACLAALLALNAASPRVAAKPPDLPDDEPIVVAPEPTPKADVCPRHAADRRTLAECDPKSMPSVLDNLRLLEQAADEIDLARKLGAAGRYTEAIEHLDHIRKLCPGSSYVRRAEEVMGEIFGVTTPARACEEQESPCCPEAGCETLTRVRNVGACYMARLGGYCAQVQAVAKPGCCCEEASACPKCEKPTRTLTITLGVSSDSGLTGSIVLNERNFDCQKFCEDESACPKCAKMHAEAMKKARQKAAGVKEQVDGLLKACYFAVREGRNAKAADLARQAHALDPKRVEADPLVYKLHLTAEQGQCEEYESPREASPVCPKCPTDPVEDNVSMRPALPAVDPEIVPALDRVLMRRSIGEDGRERIGIDFGSADGEEAEEKPSCCPCCAIAREIGLSFLGMVRAPTNYENGFVVLGLGTNGINAYSVSKYAGMKILVQYRDGLPLVWVAADRETR